VFPGDKWVGIRRKVTKQRCCKGDHIRLNTASGKIEQEKGEEGKYSRERNDGGGVKKKEKKI